MVVSIKKMISKAKKEPYAKFKVEDLNGSVEAILFPKSFEKYRNYLTPNNVVVIRGRLMGSQGQAEIIVEDMMTIDEAKKKYQPNCGEVHIKLSTTRYDEELHGQLTKIFQQHKGKAKVFLDIEDPVSGSYALETQYMSDCSDEFIANVEKAIGSRDVVELHYTN
jgi:DNA polymerase-3 subunit alpha